MGLIAKLLSFIHTSRRGVSASDAQCDPGGAPYFTAEHFQPAGDDAHPLPGDYVYSPGRTQSGGQVALGFVDPANTLQSAPGDKRIYARDSGDGTSVLELWLKNTGEGVLSNENGSVTLGSAGNIKGINGQGVFELQADGTFAVNGVTITPAGLITTPQGVVSPSVVVDGVEVDGHNHAQANDSGGNSEQDVGPMK